jgi:N-methylhydantoinase B
LLADARMISTLERCVAPHSGVAGGLPGGRTIGILDSSIYGQGHEFMKTPDQPLAKGDLLTIVTGGGGGYGDPLERDVERVVEDVEEGLVTVEAAREFYGVVFDADGKLDLAATEALRSQRRAA